VGEGQPPGDVQPQSQPAARRAGGLVCLPIPLEDAFGGLGGDAGPLVVDGQDRLGFVAAAEQLDWCAGWGVGSGVVEQVA
jgi:hypothetical protein